MAVRLALVLVLCLACQPATLAPGSLDPNAAVVVPYQVAGGGEIRFTVRPRYTEGQPVAFDLDLRAGTQQIIGPVSGQVLESALSGEQTVRRFAASELPTAEVAPGKSARVTVTWDGQADGGGFVAAQTYSLALDFIVGGDLQRRGTVIEVVPK
ncbi:MAG TPA: hypothetical protein VJQ09_02365 [Candidatus Limnocylindria bacterium]|nr:hypothetical protein [Candidatus Limnocylindria bacterium]